MALSAPLITRKRVIKVVLEAEKGTKLAATQALWVEDLEIDPDGVFIERKGTGLYRGGKEKGVVDATKGICTFKAELRGNGSNGMEAALAILLQACGLKKTSEVYQVHSTHTDDKTISIDVWEDGVKKCLSGVSGNVVFEGEEDGRMICNFTLRGIWIAPTDEALPAYSPSVTPPMLFNKCTFTLATESIKITKFSLDMGNNLVKRGNYYMITDYEPILSINPEADKVAGYDYYGIWLAGTEAAVSLILTDGTDKITFTLPKVQCREIKGSDREGIMTHDWTGQCNHDSGDDSVKIEAAAA